MFPRMQPSAIGILHAIHAVYSVALTETKEFLQDLSRQVFDMVGPPHEFFHETLILHRLDLSKSITSIKREIPAFIVPQRLQKESCIGHG